MEQKYTQLSLEDRCQISNLRQQGASISKIATAMDRSPSTIAREIKRNAAAKAIYKPAYANQIAKSRRWSGSRLARQPELQKRVLNLLSRGWSPEQVSKSLSFEEKRKVISYESIYRFIYSQITRTNGYSWRHYLPRSKSKRGFRVKKGGSALTIPNRVSIHRRPKYVEARNKPGHWEADLMCFSKYGQVLLVAHDRLSRLLIISNPSGKSATPIAHRLSELFKTLPQPLRKTITFDNGSEFAKHEHLHSIGMKTFFCDTHSPWQKGGVENAIGRMRRVLPRKTDLDTLSEADIHSHVAAYNNTPRKCLGFKTPAEVFLRQVLHFKCESTSQPPRG